uniref:PB1 domain-containing protein n=1 Tax=Schizaphis graminum TaxID=13262 RepID=A0A2S2PLY8_SCHGA
MSDIFVKFNIRHERTLIKVNMKLPKDLNELIDQLKNELKLEETDELVILCPTSDGKMIELQSDDDVNFLKKTKMAYDVITKEISCKSELVVNVIKNLPNDTKAQFMMLSKTINDLTIKADKLSNDFIKNMDEFKTSTLSIRSILAEHLQKNCGNKSKDNNFTGEVDSKDLKIDLDENKKNTEEDKEKLSSETNNNSSAMLENKRLDIPTPVPRHFDVLINKLAADGFTHNLLNVISLKRFDNDYEKTVNYLKTHQIYNKSS